MGPLYGPVANHCIVKIQMAILLVNGGNDNEAINHFIYIPDYP